MTPDREKVPKPGKGEISSTPDLLQARLAEALAAPTVRKTSKPATEEDFVKIQSALSSILERSLESLLKLGPAQQAMAVLVDDQQNMLVKAAGFEGVPNLGEEVTQLFGKMTARPHPELLSIKRSGVALSAAVSPLKDALGRVCGYTYVECPVSAGAFQYSDLRELRRLADDLSEELQNPRIEEAKKSEAPSLNTPWERSLRLLKGGALLVLLSLTWLALSTVAVFDARPQSPPSPPAKPVAALNCRTPDMAVKVFLQLTQRRDLTTAYLLLSETRRARLTEADFSAAISGWLESADEESLGRISVQRVRRGQTAVVESRDPGGRPPWEWKLIKERGNWRIENCRQGPPIGLES